jgi:hypothetical protein
MADSKAALKSKQTNAFYTLASSKGTPVVLFLNEDVRGRGPKFGGTIGKDKVDLFLRKSAAKGNFLSIVQRAPKGSSEPGPQIGRANLVVTQRGTPRLSIRLDAAADQTIYANVRRAVPEPLLAECGLDLARLTEARAAAALVRAEKAKPATA